MIDISNKIFVFQGFIDMRKSIDGLSILVETSGFEIDVGSCFLFINKGGEKIKILVRDHNGFLLIYKRLGVLWKKHQKWSFRIIPINFQLFWIQYTHFCVLDMNIKSF